MPADGCVRCHRNTPPRRPHGHNAWICQNRKACRARQRDLYRARRRGMLSVKGLTTR